jgi:hypothetical protein
MSDDVEMITRSEAIRMVERTMERKLDELEAIRAGLRGKFSAVIERKIEAEFDRMIGDFVRNMRGYIATLRRH